MTIITSVIEVSLAWETSTNKSVIMYLTEKQHFD